MKKSIANSLMDDDSIKPWEPGYIGYYIEKARARETGRKEGL